MTEQPGLRERKRESTRREIAAAAARLFRKKGFNHVRMVDIALAANVSEQTVYNYFPTKEHLIFDQDREFQQRIIGVVINRKPGETIAEATCVGALAFLQEASLALGKASGIPESVAVGPALRRVWIEMNARHADQLCEILIQNEGMHKAAAKLTARAVVAIFSVILEEVGEAAVAKKTRRDLIAELHPIIESVSQHLGS